MRKKNDMAPGKVLKTLLSQVRDYKGVSVSVMIMTVVGVALDVSIPYIISWLIDRGIQAGDMKEVWHYGFIMTGVALLSLAIGVVASLYAAKASSGFAKNLRQAMFSRTERLPFKTIDRYSSSGLITRMVTDVTRVKNSYEMTLRLGIRAPLTFLASFIMCFYINRKIGLYFLYILLILMVILLFVIKNAMPRFKKVFAGYDTVNSRVRENINGIREVKSFVREDYEIKGFEKVAVKLANLYNKAELTIVTADPLMTLSVYATLIMVSWFGAHFVVGGSMTTGELTSILTYVMNVLFALILFSMYFVNLVTSFESGRRISEVLNEKTGMEEKENPVEKIYDGSIGFKNVNFSYDGDSLILDDVNIEIKSGETIGLVGPTGCGKSTLLSMIPRFYDVDSGSVTVGGKDVRDYSLETLRQGVSIVLQKNELFRGSIIDNLRWGKKDATEEECRKACKMAGVDRFIDSLPEGYNTELSGMGTNLSGGQQQRICIARALLKEAPILILDDSTSAVDTETDRIIQKSFRENLKGITKIIVSQRLSSIETADRIIVMNDGGIEAFDTHENLLKNNEFYREFFADID